MDPCPLIDVHSHGGDVPVLSNCISKMTRVERKDRNLMGR